MRWLHGFGYLVGPSRSSRHRSSTVRPFDQAKNAKNVKLLWTKRQASPPTSIARPFGLFLFWDQVNLPQL